MITLPKEKTKPSCSLNKLSMLIYGAPKIGKSFLITQLAYHVSTGERLWGFDVRQGSVLYLALEDSFQRIQSRMF